MRRIPLLTLQDRLDRVLYSLIRVESSEQAHHLFYSIEGMRSSLGYCCPIQRRTRIQDTGNRGSRRPNNTSSRDCREAAHSKPPQLFSPFQADQWHVLIRLEYRFDSEYDEKTRQVLVAIVLSAKAQDMTKHIKMNDIKQYLAEK